MVRREAIFDFARNATDVITANKRIVGKAKEIQKRGIKEKDFLHLACAIYGECKYFITTDDRILKYKDEMIDIVDPVQFMKYGKEL